MARRGRPKKVGGKTYEVLVTFPKQELLGLLKLIPKRLEEADIEYTKQDLIREAVRNLLATEGLIELPSSQQGRTPAVQDKRLQ